MAVRPQVYWEDVREGDEIPGLVYPITETQIVLQVSGSQDFYPVHHDREFARAGGHPDIFVNTRFMRGCFSRLMTDFVGDEGWLNRFSIQMRRMNHSGDEMAVKGRIRRKYMDDSGNHKLDLDVWAENQREGQTTVCDATVTLPSKG